MTERRIGLPTGTLWVQVQQADFALEALCGFAARANRRREFLFVSKVLGKHWPARPSQMQAIHDHLAARLELRSGPWLFIGFAETATGLGQGVFESVLRRYPQAEALYVHTTRYRLAGRPLIAFEETHCHAPDQWLYVPPDPEQRQRFLAACALILIDDELTTGNTVCNLVAAYRRLNPLLEQVHIVAITQFGGPDLAARLADRLNLPVYYSAALTGTYRFEPAAEWQMEEPPPAVGKAQCIPGQIAEDLGRFGIARPLALPGSDLDGLAEGLGSEDRVLVLGTGEFMHLAFLVGLGLEQRGLQVVVQSTTRSPILLGGAIGRRLFFRDNYGEGIVNYLYNVHPVDYSRIIVCHETPRAGLDELLQVLGPRHRLYSLNLKELSHVHQSQ
ncbi:hypothetical protein GWK36_12910 [Caldichromatium japonicum]|uniref:TRSP domain C terminus to PRTase_2 n=1 Tax=Caldichromatium japonicum TaxID=2699430 RepID=A0A6G7VFD1_9GAMM|nr:phosphoribosyltransferase domain-containing protein [Caldichromatium japonicum]QIK38731.1 hypothetical protein GWK36_12910 [Caldichromatium japonicum]